MSLMYKWRRDAAPMCDNCSHMDSLPDNRSVCVIKSPFLGWGDEVLRSGWCPLHNFSDISIIYFRKFFGGSFPVTVMVPPPLKRGRCDDSCIFIKALIESDEDSEGRLRERVSHYYCALTSQAEDAFGHGLRPAKGCPHYLNVNRQP